MKGGEKMSFITPLSLAMLLGVGGWVGLFISALHLGFWEVGVILIFVPQNSS